MKSSDKPIIETLLDNDWYQFKMAHFFMKMGHTDIVEYNFTDRGKMNLAQLINLDELKEELEHLFNLTLGFNDSEFIVKHHIPAETVDILNQIRAITRPDFQIFSSGTNLGIRYAGPLPLYVLYETPILAIVNELYTRAVVKYLNMNTANIESKMINQIVKKTNILKNNPLVKFVEFGTRRRFSKLWQTTVVNHLETCLAQKSFLGTSNVYLSRLIGRAPKGTMAHQVPMYYAAKAWLSQNAMRLSQIEAIKDWGKVWDMKETFWLTDTFTTEWLLNYEISPIIVNMRQDSGNPYHIGEIYSKRGAQRVMFSDGLNLETILCLFERFQHRFDCFFGWGTDLTNDGIINPLKVVIKLFKVGNITTVKLGDGEGKEMGEHAVRYREIFSR